MRESALLKRIEKDVAEHGLRGFSRLAGVSAQYLCDILKRRRRIGPKVARYYGLKEVPSMERVFRRLG